MIRNDKEFQQTVEQLQRMYRALADLRLNMMSKNPRMFAVMAEGPLDQICQFQQEIENFVGANKMENQESALVEEHEGDLREIDLDELSFILRNAGEIQQIPCTFEEELLEGAKGALDRRVRVTGTREIQPGRRQSGKLHVARLVVME
jgi:hypothetical protein